MPAVRLIPTFTVILSTAGGEVTGCRASEVPLRLFPENSVFNYRNTSMNETDIREKVREHYASVAEGRTSCCSEANSGCAGENISQQLGYSAEELASLPDQAEMGLGCGNPISFAKLRPGFIQFEDGASQDRLTARTQFNLDVGGGFEYDLLPHIGVRVDLGETIIPFGNAMLLSGPGVVGAPLGTQHNFEAEVGAVVHF